MTNGNPRIDRFGTSKAADFPVFGNDAKALARLENSRSTPPEVVSADRRNFTGDFGTIALGTSVVALKEHKPGRHEMTPEQSQASTRINRDTPPQHRLGD